MYCSYVNVYCHRVTTQLQLINIGCPTTYQTRYFFNNSKTNEDIATKQTHTTDTFLFISYTTNVLLFKSRCNIFIGFRIIKEMPGLVGSGTPCIFKCLTKVFSLIMTFGTNHVAVKLLHRAELKVYTYLLINNKITIK